MVEVLEKRLAEWIVTRRTGSFIYGLPRLGKTIARRYSELVLPERFPGLRIISMPCRQLIRPSEDSFFEHLLACSGHAEPGKGKVSAKRRRLIEFLVNLCEKSSQSQLVVFADDAQRLREADYNWLMDVGNELKERDVDLSIFFFGQTELAHQRSAFQEAKKKHIIGRFMTDELVFHHRELRRTYCWHAGDGPAPGESFWSIVHKLCFRNSLSWKDVSACNPIPRGWDLRFPPPQAIATRLCEILNTDWRTLRFVRWSPKVGQDGSLNQTPNNDPHVQEASSAQSRSESPRWP